VRHEQDRELKPVEDALELGPHARARVGVEGRHRLVEQEDARVACEGAGEPDPLALAAGELVGTCLRELGDAEPVEHFGDVRAARVSDVLLHAHVREEGVLLEDEADAALLGRPVDPGLGVEEHRAVERHPPALGPDEPGHHPQDARLARAGGPDEGEGFAADGQR
jgi:hypothetical protein